MPLTGPLQSLIYKTAVYEYCFQISLALQLAVSKISSADMVSVQIYMNRAYERKGCDPKFLLSESTSNVIEVQVVSHSCCQGVNYMEFVQALFQETGGEDLCCENICLVSAEIPVYLHNAAAIFRADECQLCSSCF